MAESPAQISSTRRAFLRNAALASGAMAVAAASSAEAGSQSDPDAKLPDKTKPNVLMICADQFRADFIGANGENPSVKTPNLDALAARGTNFRKAVCNQPLCSPSRASFMTGMHATNTGVWKLGLELDHSLPTIATVLKQARYSTNFMGKWHVSRPELADGQKQLGWIPPGPSRAGFDDIWEGANTPEVVSHPYEGNYWISDGTNIGFKDEYRVDFIADRAANFLKQKHDKPWLLYVSQLEPHQQNDVDAMVPPHRYADQYLNPFIPQDLRDLPGNWPSRIAGYYGCVQAVDDCVGKLVATLEKTGQLENTIIVFFSDHGCHFRTRMGEYKRVPHDAAIRIPLIFAGPGFDHALALDEVVSLLDLTPTLLDGADVSIPSGMQGKSLKPLSTDAKARAEWDSAAYIQISASMVGRALRTKDWTFAVYDPNSEGNGVSGSTQYIDYAMYHNGADPYQKTNLVGRPAAPYIEVDGQRTTEGRPDHKETGNRLREELKHRIVANGETEPVLKPQLYFV